LQRLCKQIPGARVRRGDRQIFFDNVNGLIQARSADAPDSLRGSGLDFLALEEFAFMSEEAWSAVLRPALADKQGRAIFISTPNGYNHFYKFYRRGQDHEKFPDWMSWQFPSTSNPLITEKELAEARRTMPAAKFRQEFLAEFTDTGGTVFRVGHALHKDFRTEAENGHQYVAGIDWAQADDFTAFVVLDATEMKMVYVECMNSISFTDQLDRVRVLLDSFSPEVVVSEQNSIGAALNDQLIRDGYPIQPQFVNWANKPKFITNLAMLIEEGKLKILDDPEVVEQFSSFTSRPSTSVVTRIVYSAPSGAHDDIVIATALAASVLSIGEVYNSVGLW